jgi:CrcB protein
MTFLGNMGEADPPHQSLATRHSMCYIRRMIMTLPLILSVALGGAAGSVARFVVSHRLTQAFGAGFPYGTLAVNVAGSLLMGLLMGWLLRDPDRLQNTLYALLGIGFLGGFTTFSSFALDVVKLLQNNQNMALALGYVLVSVIVSVGAVMVGIQMMKVMAV